MASILGTALSGLTAAQHALETASHNIANVNTEGYSRQRVELGTRPAEFTGAGYIGQGVNVNTVARSYDR
ncbi:MAG: flagellar basal body protein, partial [Methylobacter sp.]